MRVLIYGGRDWDHQEWMDAELDRLHREHKFTGTINGGQVSRQKRDDGDHLYGADWQASVWSQKNGMPPEYFFANWHEEGKAAGPLRNQRMADAKPELGIEFPGGKGTRDMRRRLDAAGIRVIEVSS